MAYTSGPCANRQHVQQQPGLGPGKCCIGACVKTTSHSLPTHHTTPQIQLPEFKQPSKGRCLAAAAAVTSIHPVGDERTVPPASFHSSTLDTAASHDSNDFDSCTLKLGPFCVCSPTDLPTVAYKEGRLVRDLNQVYRNGRSTQLVVSLRHSTAAQIEDCDDTRCRL